MNMWVTAVLLGSRCVVHSGFPKDKADIVRKLKKDAKNSDLVYLASDDDREGEAISWHLKEALELDHNKTRRIVFREITKNAVLNAIDNPSTEKTKAALSQDSGNRFLRCSDID